MSKINNLIFPVAIFLIQIQICRLTQFNFNINYPKHSINKRQIKKLSANISSAFKRVRIDENGKIKDKFVFSLLHMPPDLNNKKLSKHQIISWWSKRRITWLLKNSPLTLTYQQAHSAFEKAFQLWSNQSALVFKSICFNDCFKLNKSNADILIEFSRYEEHDKICEYKFIDSTLAHAYYPEKGIAHFNFYKKWSLDDTKFIQSLNSNENFKSNLNSFNYEYNLITVAAHEIGHLIGFGHSSLPNSMMNAKYKSNFDELKLSKEDVEALQYLYGNPNDELFKLSRKNRKKYNLV